MGLFTKKPEPKPVSYAPVYTHIIEIARYKDSDNKWFACIKEANGNVILSTPMAVYETELDCRRDIERLRHALQNGTYRVDVEGE